MNGATAEPGPTGNLASFRGTEWRQAVVDAGQDASDSAPLDLRPPETATESAPVAPVAEPAEQAETPVRSVAEPAAAEPTPDRAEGPATDPPNESVADELPRGSLIAAALGTAAALSAAAAANSGGLLLKLKR